MSTDNTQTEPQQARTGRDTWFFDPYALVMNLLVYPGLILMSLVFILGGLVIAPMAHLLTRRPLDRIVRLGIWVYGRAWMILFSPFVRFRRENLTQACFPRPCIIVVNHLSFFDTYCMGALPFSNVSFAVRAWPFKMLWYAPFMRWAKYVDTESRGQDAALQQGREVLESGAAVLFFPEGHRSRDGVLQRFYSGAFKLAVEANVPVVPLCLTGTGTLLPPGRWTLRPTEIHIRALPWINPSDFPGESGHVAMRKYAKAKMAEAITDMRTETFAGGRNVHV